MSTTFAARPDRATGTLYLVGELDVDDVESFNLALRHMSRLGGPTLTIDLSQLTYIGSAGLGCLIRANQTFTHVRLTGIRPAQLRLLETTKLVDQFETVTDASHQLTD